MLTTADFLNAAKWSGIFTLVCAVVTVLAFVVKWGIRFRLVGITGFMGVVTGGLFALGLVPFTRTVIPGAIRYSLAYDNGANQAAIVVPAKVTETELEATLRQAASDLFSYGRIAQGDDKLTVRARTILHPQPGVSEPLYLGEVKQALGNRNDENITVTINRKNFAKLPKNSDV